MPGKFFQERPHKILTCLNFNPCAFADEVTEFLDFRRLNVFTSLLCRTHYLGYNLKTTTQDDLINQIIDMNCL